MLNSTRQNGSSDQSCPRSNSPYTGECTVIRLDLLYNVGIFAKKAIKCSVTVYTSIFQLHLVMLGYLSLSRSEAIAAVNEFSLDLQFTIDVEATWAKDPRLKHSNTTSTKDAYLNN